jgi:hypothetical protein
MTAFPGAEATFTGFTSSHTLSQDQHASQHNLEQSEIVATQHKIGTGSSTPVSGTLLRGTGAGTSSWAQANLTTDVTGVLPQANGGTGTTLATGTGKAVYDTSPTVSNPSLTGGGSWTGSPSLTTPTIASFTNAQHNHQNAAGGGQLSAAAISSLDLSLQTLSNPYSFSVYKGTAQNVGTGATKVLFDSEEYDTNNNFDNVTNFRYTAPVTGKYQINFTVSMTSAGAGTNITAYLYKNGSQVWLQNVDANAGFSPGVTHAKDHFLSAGDFLEVYIATSVAAKALDVTLLYNNSFSGHLISQL